MHKTALLDIALYLQRSAYQKSQSFHDFSQRSRWVLSCAHTFLEPYARRLQKRLSSELWEALQIVLADAFFVYFFGDEAQRSSFSQNASERLEAIKEHIQVLALGPEPSWESL